MGYQTKEERRAAESEMLNQNANIVSPAPPNQEILKKQEEARKKDKAQRNKLIALGVVGVGVPAYSIYKIGSLADKIPNERKYIAASVVGGTFMVIQSMNPSVHHQGIIYSGASILAATASYSVSRGLFKQNPKTSLVLGGLVGVALFGFLTHLDKGISGHTKK